MGMYDVVLVPCPSCGTKNGFQSKGGDCYLTTYEVDEAPAEVLEDAGRHDEVCESCGVTYGVEVEKKVTVRAVRR